MKQDLKIEIGALNRLLDKIGEYRLELQQISEDSNTFLSALQRQDSVSYAVLSEEWESCIIKYESEISNRLWILEDMLSGYIREMTDYIHPKVEESMMRVDSVDIRFNLMQMEECVSELSHIWMDTESSYADYQNYATIGCSEAELAAHIIDVVSPGGDGAV